MARLHVLSEKKENILKKQDNTGRHQLYDSTKRTRKFSLKWKYDFPWDSLEENNRICRRSLTMTACNLRRKTCNSVPRISLRFAIGLRKILYIICASSTKKILNVMCDYNEIYLSIFSVFLEIMLRAKWDLEMMKGFSTF